MTVQEKRKPEKRKQKICIAAGGSIDERFAAKLIGSGTFDHLIAADRGMEFFRRQMLDGRRDFCPDEIIGDFDSVSLNTLSFFEKLSNDTGKPKITRLNPIKDDTDMEHSIRTAIEEGAEEITVLGATGSRLDHVLGSVALLGIGLESGVEISIVDPHNRIRMKNASFSLEKNSQFGRYLSLIPYSGPAKVSLKGFFYEANELELSCFNSRGVSNEITAQRAEVTVHEGCLLVIESGD